MSTKLPIAERLKRYTDLLGEIDLQEARVASITNNGSITARRAITGAKEHLEELLEAESAEYEALNAIIKKLPTKEQRQIILARYIDRMNWSCVACVVFGRNKDFNAKRDNYMRRIYRIHGTALANANKLL